MRNYITLIRNCSILRTIYFNYKVLPFNKAWKLPVLVGKRVRFRNIGTVILSDNLKNKVHLATLPMFNTTKYMETIWDNKGTVHINGPIVIASSSVIHVGEKGHLIFEGENRVGAHTSILCENSISIGKKTGISWYSQICDSDFHFFKDRSSPIIHPRSYPITIGEKVWVGNHCIIGKGVKIADGCICGMGSLVIKTCETPNTLLLGSPAKPKKNGVARIFDSAEEAQLIQLLG